METVNITVACAKVTELTKRNVHPSVMGGHFKVLYNRVKSKRWYITTAQIAFFADFWKSIPVKNHVSLREWATQNNRKIPLEYNPHKIVSHKKKEVSGIDDAKLQRMVEKAVGQQLKDMNDTLKEIKGSLLLKDGSKDAT